MTFDPGTWWLVVGLLGLGGTALAFLLKRNMTESDRTKKKVEVLEQTAAKQAYVDKSLDKLAQIAEAQGKTISHIEKTYVEKTELASVRKELMSEYDNLNGKLDDLRENCFRKDDALREFAIIQDTLRELQKYTMGRG